MSLQICYPNCNCSTQTLSCVKHRDNFTLLGRARMHPSIPRRVFCACTFPAYIFLHDNDNKIVESLHISREGERAVEAGVGEALFLCYIQIKIHSNGPVYTGVSSFNVLTTCIKYLLHLKCSPHVNIYYI